MLSISLRGWTAAALVGCAGLLTSGCGGGGGIELVPVSGTVTLDGAPLKDAHVSFQPAPEYTNQPVVESVGTTDAEGKYELRTVSFGDDSGLRGAMVGKHAVRITIPAEEEAPNDAGGDVKTRIPLRYRDGSLTFEVKPEGHTDADFKITTR